MKSKSKFLIIFFVILILLFSSFCFATDSINNNNIISNEESKNEDIRDSDLYIGSKGQYDIRNTINGDAFIAVDTLNIDPNDNGGIIEGNLFAVANNVNIKSNVSYSDTEKDDLGNPAISIDKFCTVSGNAFISTNKFVLEPGSKIYGDLFICAKEVELSQGSIVYGNVYIVADNFILNSEIGKSLYATVKSFDMQYFGFISRDLHLDANNATLNGYVYRNSYINADNLTTNDKFINQKDFNVDNAKSFTYSGEVKGNASINAKQLSFKDKDNDNNLICTISGNLSYSSKNEISIPDGIVSGEINYSNYTNKTSNSVFANIWNYVLALITSLVIVYAIYLLLSKFAPKYLNKLSNISGLTCLKYLGIGILFVILIPIISLLLFMSHIGSILGLILILVYIILLIIAKPIFIISISKYIKNKAPKFSIYLYILAISVIISLISLIPFLGFIISLILILMGTGCLLKSLKV